VKRVAPGWRKPPHAKRQWGSQPGKEQGNQSIQEGMYIDRMQLAMNAGTMAARDPAASERSCPAKYTGDAKEYWLAAFRQERSRG